MKKLTPLFVLLSLIAKSQCPSDSLNALSFPYSFGSSCTALVQSTAAEKAEAYFLRALCIKDGLSYTGNCASNTDSILAYDFPYVPGTNCSLLQSATMGDRAEVFFLRKLLGVSGGGGGGSGWLLTGNSGTTPGTNFLGTTDDKVLLIKQNNVVSGWIDGDNGNTFWGQSSGTSSVYTTVTGTSNTGIGTGVFEGLTSGSGNTGLGSGIALSLGIGSYNTAIGAGALAGITNGNYNTVVGAVALNSGNSFDNSSFGYAAGANATGHDNTFLGDSAGLNDVAGNYNIYIGSPSGLSNKSLKNQLYLGDSTGASALKAIKWTGSLDPYYSSNYQPGSSGQYLQSKGANVSPQWVSEIIVDTGTNKSSVSYYYLNSTWTGSTNLTTLGTISSGTWQGTAIAAGYGGTGISTSSSTGAAQVSSGTWSIGTLPVSDGGTGATTASAHKYFGGPSGGSAAAPSFRTIYGNDLPATIDTTFVGRYVVTGTDTTRIATTGRTSAYLTFTAQANTTYRISCVVICTCSSTGGVNFELTAPSGATSTYVIVKGYTTAVTAYSQSTPTLNAFTGTAFSAAAATDDLMTIEGYVTTSSTSGTVAIAYRPVTDLQIITLLQGSAMNVYLK